MAFVVANTQLSFAVQMGAGFTAGVARVGGVTGEVVGPDIVDGQGELKMFQDLKTRVKDGISVFTLAPEIFTQPMAAAVSDDIPLIAVDNPPLAASNVKLFVGNDNYQLGKMLADEAVAKLPANATGKIILGTSAPGVKVLDRRAKGIRDELMAKLPGVTVVGPFDTKQETAANLAAWQTLTEVNRDAIAFLGTGDADGWNLAAIKAKTKATWMAGAFDLDPKSLAAVKAGQLALVSPEHFVKGEVAGRLQAQHAKDGKALPEGWYYTPGLAVNESNIDAVMARQASTDATAAAVASTVDQVLGDASYFRKMSDVS
ncbi:sugar ABC transporter substrate-binding protein [Actinoplanes sp. NPDC026619]|uniref:sugar ABC transporter substrate-binding protein n=1 Tax=Actinoplanes sp. NPDC026619 TaxID=3155798 RepID=UPI0033F10B36